MKFFKIQLRTFACLYVILFSKNAFTQAPEFVKVGAYNLTNLKFGYPKITDGTWVRNNVVFCGYRNVEDFGILQKKPWIGVFDQATGNLVYEKAWESSGGFTKVSSDWSTGLITAVTECYGQFFTVTLDTALNEKGAYYDDHYTDNSFCGHVGSSGGYLSIMHLGNMKSELTKYTDMYKFKVLYLNNKMQKVFESEYIDSTRILLALSDSYGSVIGVSRKLDGENDELFRPYQMEIFTINSKNVVNRKFIKWKLPTRNIKGINCKMNISYVHSIVNPNAKGAGIIANVAFYDPDNISYPKESLSTIYMYMNIDGTIEESSIINLVNMSKYDMASTRVLIYGTKAMLLTYPKDESGSEISIFDTELRKITFSAQLEKQFPMLEPSGFDDFGDVDESNITTIFNDYKTYGFSSVVYYMMNLD